jgi:uncharacterized membrane protein YcgQ (UPF0703/DUF1980 family)
MMHELTRLDGMRNYAFTVLLLAQTVVSQLRLMIHHRLYAKALEHIDGGQLKEQIEVHDIS